MTFFLILLSLLSSSTAFLFPMMGGGDRGCSFCCPSPKPYCPPPSCGCGNSGSFSGSSSGCGGGCRRKREVLMVVREDDLLKCNSRELKELLEKNLKKSVIESMDSLEKASRNYSDYAVMCNENPIAFFVNAPRHCQVEKNSVYCLMVQLDASLHLM